MTQLTQRGVDQLEEARKKGGGRCGRGMNGWKEVVVVGGLPKAVVGLGRDHGEEDRRGTKGGGHGQGQV